MPIKLSVATIQASKQSRFSGHIILGLGAFMDSILVVEAHRYAGQYVTTADFGQTEVITASPSAISAYKQAVSKGYKDPVIIYVPKDGEQCHACY